MVSSARTTTPVLHRRPFVFLPGKELPCLPIDETVFGPDHPNVAIRVNNLGTVLYALGDYGGARAAFGRTLAIDEATFGPDHPNVATHVNNLGTVLYTLGDYAGARPGSGASVNHF